MAKLNFGNNKPNKPDVETNMEESTLANNWTYMFVDHFDDNGFPVFSMANVTFSSTKEVTQYLEGKKHIAAKAIKVDASESNKQSVKEDLSREANKVLKEQQKAIAEKEKAAEAERNKIAAEKEKAAAAERAKEAERKRLAEERAREAEQRRLAEEKAKSEEIERKRLAEEREKEAERRRLAAEQKKAEEIEVSKDGDGKEKSANVEDAMKTKQNDDMQLPESGRMAPTIDNELPSKGTYENPNPTKETDKAPEQLRENQSNNNRSQQGFGMGHGSRNTWQGKQNNRHENQSGWASGGYQQVYEPSYGMQDIMQYLYRLSDRIDNLDRNIRDIRAITSSSADRIIQKVNNKIVEAAGDCMDVTADDTKPLATTDFVKQKINRLEANVTEVIESVNTNLRETQPALETIQGKICTVEELLSKKGITIQREANPANNDEKTIINAQRLTTNLINGLVSMALEYAKNQEAIDNASDLQTRLQTELDEKISKAHDEGIRDAFKQILSKYADIGSFLSIDANGPIAAIMKNYGLHEDEELRTGKEILISDDSYMAKVQGYMAAGNYQITQSAYYLGDEIIQLARVQLIG